MNETHQVERALLGAMLLNPDAVDVAIDAVGTSAKFAGEGHGQIFEAMARLEAEGKRVDLILLIERLTQAGTLAQAGGAAYVADLDRAIETSHNVAEYAEEVNRLHTTRTLAHAATKFLAQAKRGAIDFEALEAYEREIGAAFETHDPGAVVHVADAFTAVLKDIEQRRKSDHTITGIPSGIEALDVKMMGLRPGTLNIIGARPSVGKSALAVNLAHAAAKAGHPVLIFSMEMTAESVTRRLLTIETGTPYAILSGRFNPLLQNQRLSDAAPILSALPIEIDPTPGLTLTQFRARSRRFARRHPEATPLIVLDYLQLMGGDAKRNRYEVLGEVTRNAKILAGEIGCPVVVLSQLAREADTLDDPFRGLPMLRESGNVEQDADTVLIMLRTLPDWLKAEVTNAGIEPAEIVNCGLVKNRDGETGLVPLRFHKSTQRMEGF